MQRNVFGDPLKSCSERPLTGFYRSGCCHTGPDDLGLHTVCVEVTAEFLAFSKLRGNDLSTPMPEFDFPGLEPGDRCSPRPMRRRSPLSISPTSSATPSTSPRRRAQTSLVTPVPIGQDTPVPPRPQ
jgi:uncharacterized protein (DUF2237 family)